ncbi:hypothetical protein D3C81_1737820 [compost metagenome]
MPGFIDRADDLRAFAHLGTLQRREAMLASELLVQGGGIGCHGAVEIHRDVRYQPVAFEHVQVIHQQLRSADRERRHQGDAMTQQGLVDHIGQVTLRGLCRV